MSTIDSNYAAQMANQLANLDVQASLSKNDRQQTLYKSQLEAVSKLDSALKSFRSSVRTLDSVGSSMLSNSASMSQEGYASTTLTSKAQPGSYQFFVKQLASTHQVSLGVLTDEAVGNATGEMQFQDATGAQSFNVDLAGVNTLQELVAAINSAEGNSGVKAALIRSNGEVSVVLSSDKSGADNRFSVSSALGNSRVLGEGKDALVMLGGENGMELKSSSNTFESLADGLSVTFNKVHAAGEAPLTLTVAQDASATKGKVQKFVDAFNTLMSSFDSLTGSGSESSTRGPLAGDASVRAIEATLNQMLRSQMAGVSLIDFGVAADRNGKLAIDTARFEKAIAANPDGFEKLFSDKDALFDRIDKQLNLYVGTASGSLTARKDQINQNIKRANSDYENIEKQYEMRYSRYLRQYTNMMQVMSSMEQTSGLFSSSTQSLSGSFV